MGKDKTICVEKYTNYKKGQEVCLLQYKYCDGSYFYYLDSTPNSITCGYSGTHNYSQIKLKFDAVVEDIRKKHI